MSSASPILPPGSPLRRPGSAIHSKFVLSVCALLVVHLFVLAGLLIQGCQRQEAVNSANAFATNDLPALIPPPDAAADFKAPEPPPIVVKEAKPAVSEPPPLPPSAGFVGGGSGPETPKVDLPAPPSLPKLDQSGSTITYVVKPGDTLTKIAKAHQTTVQAIRSASNLKTDKILVGQKLKVPGGAGASSNAPISPH